MKQSHEKSNRPVTIPGQPVRSGVPRWRGIPRPLQPLPNAHRPDVKAFLQHKGVIWAGSRVGLYRIENGRTAFLPDWRDSEIIALGPDGNGILVSGKRNGSWRIFRCNKAGLPVAELPLPNDEPTCLFGGKTVWLGGKHNLYRYRGRSWEKCLTVSQAGQVDWIRPCGERLTVAILKRDADGCPVLLTASGNKAVWKTTWTGRAGDRVRAFDGKRIVCKWTGDQEKPTLLAKPVLAASFLDAGDLALLRESTLVVQDCAGAETFSLRDDRFSRGLWVVRYGRNFLVAGEQGVFAVDIRTRRILDVTGKKSCPRYASRIKHIWSIGEDRLLLCATHGTFMTDNGGVSWFPVEGAFDILHVRRVFCASDGKLILGTRDGIFSSTDGGLRWKALTWRGDGIQYDKLSGIAAFRRKLLWGGKGGLFIQSSSKAQPRRIQTIGTRRIEEIVNDGANKLLVLCHDGALFSMDAADEEAKRIVQFPSKDGRTVIRHGADLIVLGRESVYKFRDGRVTPVAMPMPHIKCSFTVSRDHLAAFSEQQAWIAGIDDLRWQPIEGWPRTMKKPDASMSPDGSYIVFTDCHRLWRMDFDIEATGAQSAKSCLLSNHAKQRSNR